MNIKLSIFFPIYNELRYLPLSLEAMLAQSNEIDRLIIVDDASSDGSQNYIKQHVPDSPNVEVVLKKENKGLFDSHRIAHEKIGTDTDFYYSGAADDWILPGFIKQCREMLERYPQAGLCCTNRLFFKEKEGRMYEDKLAIQGEARYIPPEEVRELISNSDSFIFPSNAVFVNWKMLKEIGGFPAEMEWHADWFAYTVLALRGGICFVPECLTVCRFNEDSYSVVGMNDSRQQQKVYGNLLELLKKDQFQDVRAAFREPSLYTISKKTGREMLAYACKNPSRWWFLSLKYIRIILWRAWKSNLFSFLWIFIGKLGAWDLWKLKLKVLKCFGAKIYGSPRIEPDVWIEKPWNIKFHEHVQIQRKTLIRADDKITLGAYSIIECGSTLWSGHWDMETQPPIWRTSPINISERSIIPAGAMVRS